MFHPPPTGLQAARVTVTQPQFVVMALYVRDRFGIRHSSPALPPADPVVEEVPSGFGAELDQQWNSWWTALLAHLDDVPDALLPHDLSFLPADAALASATSSAFAAAWEWSSARKLEFAPPTGGGAADRIIRAVGDRPLGPSAHDLTLLVLPLQGRAVHPVSDRLVIVPVGLAAEGDGRHLAAAVEHWRGGSRS